MIKIVRYSFYDIIYNMTEDRFITFGNHRTRQKACWEFSLLRFWVAKLSWRKSAIYLDIDILISIKWNNIDLRTDRSSNLWIKVNRPIRKQEILTTLLWFKFSLNYVGIIKTEHHFLYVSDYILPFFMVLFSLNLYPQVILWLAMPN